GGRGRAGGGEHPAALVAKGLSASSRGRAARAQLGLGLERRRLLFSVQFLGGTLRRQARRRRHRLRQRHGGLRERRGGRDRQRYGGGRGLPRRRLVRGRVVGPVFGRRLLGAHAKQPRPQAAAFLRMIAAGHET